MKRVVMLLVVTIVVVCGCGVVAINPEVSAVFGLPPHPFTTSSTVSCPTAETGSGTADLDQEQLDNAAVIYEVGLSLDMGERGAVIGIATAMQESTLHNYGDLGERNDHDSLGLFQQRPSQGWGTAEQILDPEFASTSFFTRLRDVDGWQTMELTVAAQRVQRSAFPDAYAKWETLATTVVAVLSEACSDDWVVPVEAGIVSGYRTSERPDHEGIDFGAARHTPILAAGSGTVTTATCNASTSSGRVYSCDTDGGLHISGCGWYVDILHPDSTLTRYCHMASKPVVTKGQTVSVGDELGNVGSSGNSSGPHLHFETHDCDGSEVSGCVPTDPVEFLARRGITVA